MPQLQFPRCNNDGEREAVIHTLDGCAEVTDATADAVNIVVHLSLLTGHRVLAPQVGAGVSARNVE